VVSYAGWQAVDRAEREAGEPQGRPRVKLCSFDELLEAAKDDGRHRSAAGTAAASRTTPAP